VSRLNKFSSLILCYVTDRRSLPGHKPAEQSKSLLEKIAAASQAGIEWIQIREKDLSGKDCGALVHAALCHAGDSTEAKTTASRILVNDRLDIAMAEHAGGVHLGEKSLPIEETARLAAGQLPGEDFLIGVSCHSLEAARVATFRGADYLFFGPVFATPSKAAYGAPQGIKRLAEVCGSVSIPVLAIGGVTLANAADCLAVGASGIASIRLFQDAPDLTLLVHSLRGLRV